MSNRINSLMNFHASDLSKFRDQSLIPGGGESTKLAGRSTCVLSRIINDDADHDKNFYKSLSSDLKNMVILGLDLS